MWKKLSQLGLTTIFLIMICDAKADVPYRWQTSFAQGNTIAGVVINGGDSFTISCNEGGITHNTAQDLFVSYSVNPANQHEPAAQINGADTLQFVIDGNTFELPGNGLWLANGALDSDGNLNSLLQIEAALANAKEEYFKFEVPDANFSVDISTVGANTALASIRSCN